MAEMLADPKWIPAHSLLLAGFVALLAGLPLYGRTSLPERSRRWLRIAVIGTILQIIEMAFHTAAMVDHDHLVSGRNTRSHNAPLACDSMLPDLWIDGWWVLNCGMRDRVLGSVWIGWLGIAGLVANGLAPPLVVLLNVEAARILFPLLLLFALWLILAGLWPLPAKVNHEFGDEQLKSAASR